MAHFLGAKGAAKLIGQSEQAPGASAVSVFPGAARANRSIFFNSDGRARNVAEVSAELSGRFQVARTAMPASPARRASRARRADRPGEKLLRSHRLRQIRRHDRS